MHSAEEAYRLLRSAEEIYSADDVESAIDRVAAQVTAAVEGSNPLVLCVMRGGILFAGRLLVRLGFPLEFDYVDATRYHDRTSGGALNWRYLPEAKVRGRTILVVDDILDEGVTLAAIRDKLAALCAQRVWLAVLTDKLTGRAKAAQADFVGLTVPDHYVFGCGMDVHGYWRNLPAIYALNGGRS